MGMSIIRGVPQNGCFIWKIPICIDDIGPPFQETPTSRYFSFLIPVYPSVNSSCFYWKPIEYFQLSQVPIPDVLAKSQRIESDA